MIRGIRVSLVCIALLVCVCAEDVASSVVIDPGTAEMQHTKPQFEQTQPTVEDVFARGLVSDKLTGQQILSEYNRYASDTSKKRFEGTTLGFVTPWNGHGYDVAKIFRSKFDIIAPVWFDMGLAEDGEVTLSGTHDVDTEWLRAVRGGDGQRSPLILPRVTFRLSRLDNAIITRMLELLTSACINYDFDGYVLEMLIHPQLANAIQLIASKLKEQLRARGREIMLIGVAQANRPKQSASFDVIPHETFAKLSTTLDKFVIMTYDFSRGLSFGPNAPIKFVEEAIKTVITRPDGSVDRELAGRLLVGIPMYGYRRGQPVVASQVLDWLESEEAGEIIWHGHTKEHYFGQGFVFTYPTPLFIEERLRLIQSYGCGVSIWEIGQGMDFFYDLF